MPEPIAIIGLACLFPGATTPESFWQNLLAGADSRTEATERQMHTDPVWFKADRKGVTDRYYCTQGGYIHDFTFDPEGFRVPAARLAGLDDVFQWPLHVAREALRDANLLDDLERLARCGVILGNLSFPTKSSNHLALPLYREALEPVLQDLLGRPDFRLPGFSEIPPIPPLPKGGVEGISASGKGEAPENLGIAGKPATLLAEALGLSGRSYALDAACASSLYSIGLACHTLWSERTDLMLAGAVSAADPFFVNMGFSIFQAYPEVGKSRPLDRTSGGLFASEGAGMFVLKRLSVAERDGDRIHALIPGVGLSNDGRGQFVLSPNPKGQQFAFERAYASSGVDPQSVDYIECHATGTPLGDKVELNSMEAFFGNSGTVPPIGSVKSNLGHMLTAAGMGGMTKVILALQQGRIPGTIHVEQPHSSENGTFAAEQILRETTDWPHNRPERRAAVSAFGFGGCNAHLILENSRGAKFQSSKGERGATKPTTDHRPPTTTLAIIGMDGIFGEFNGITAIQRAFLNGEQAFRSLPETRWRGLGIESSKSDGASTRPETENRPPTTLQGAWLESFEMDFLRFKLPPNPQERLIPQQLLTLEVTDRALQQTSLKAGQNVAVLVAMEAELELHRFRGRVNLAKQIEDGLTVSGVTLSAEQQVELTKLAQDTLLDAVPVNQFTSFIGNIMASRISALWDFSGPAFTISAEENSALKALEVAQMLLESGVVEAAVVAAVDLAGSAESVMLRGRGMSQGWTPGEGAGAVVLKPLEQAQADEDIIHAVVEAVAFAREGTPDSVAVSAKIALESAGLTPDQIGLVSLHTSGISEVDAATATSLQQIYSAAVLSSASAHLGHTFAASGMAALLQTVVALRQRTIPGMPSESRPWFCNAGDEPRRAAVSSLGQDGCAAHLVLSETQICPGPTLAKGGDDSVPMKRGGASVVETGGITIMPLVAADVSGLRTQLDALVQDLGANTALPKMARQAFETQREVQGSFALALVGDSLGELRQEAEAAKSGIEVALDSGADWVTPRGSSFSPQPLGPKGKVAFTYPGGFNSYIGNSRTLFQLVPELHDSMGSYTNRLADLLHDHKLYPRSLQRLSESEIECLQDEFVNTPIAMFESGITTGVLHTQALREGFGLEPQLAFGYSMGEVTMMFALGVWGPMDPMSDLLNVSPLFKERLCGPMNTVREAWELGPDEFRQETLWQWYTLRSTPEAAQAAIDREERAYLILINTPQEVVMAGEPAACERAAQTLGVEPHPIQVTDVVHCAPVKADYDEVKRVHTNPVVSQPDIRFYSADTYDVTELDADGLGDNIARIYGRTVDYTKLIEATYRDGARIFVDLGPRVSCAKWIAETLGERPHLAVGMSRRGVDDRVQVIRTLARLYSHRVPLDLERLYPEVPERHAKQLMQTITLGGEPIQTICVEENRAKFRVAETLDSPQRRGEHRENPPRPSFAKGGSAALVAQGGAPVLVGGLGAYPHQVDSAHSAFLGLRHEGLRQMAAAIQQQMENPQEIPPNPPLSKEGDGDHPATKPSTEHRAPKTEPPIFDKQDLLEFAGGKVANVFGPEYAEYDTFRRCVRLPMEPYLLVSRVTKLAAKRGVLEPSTITTEYDIPEDAWYCTDGQIPWAVAVESGQCDLLLISYLGIDFENQGERVYRLLDCTLTYLADMPRAGETLRYDICIDSFARSGGTLLFFFRYECFVGERMVMRMDGGCAGFFTNEELAEGQGVIRTAAEVGARANARKLHFEPLLRCEKTTFTREELLALSSGNPARCFGAHYAQPGRNPSLKTAPEQFLMHDRIVKLDRSGGPWGCGLVITEKDLAPDHWYFPCHFKDDPVMAGSLMAEGCVQLMQFFMLDLGLQTHTQDATFQPIHGMSQIVRCRGQVIPSDPRLTYRMEVKEIGLEPIPYALADIDILLGDRIVVDFRNLGVQLVEKDSSFRLTQQWFEQNPDRPALKSPLNPPFAKGGEAKPGGFFPNERGELLAQTANRKPQTKNIADDAQLWEFALGDVAKCMGSDYAVYANRPVQRNPNSDLQLLSRVQSFTGTRRKFEEPMRIVGEYDVPAEAWYFRDNAHPSQLPYAVLMEIALQPCGFISAYSGALFHYPNLDLHYRNLDGNGTLLADPDLRDKTIVSEITLKSTVASGNTIIQTHDFALFADGKKFYSGDTVFGYFTDEALTNQVGLDGGKLVPAWLESVGAGDAHEQTVICWNLAESSGPCFQAPEGRPHQRLATRELNLLDELRIVPDGGSSGKGYVYGLRTIDPEDWFFPCHFHQDPVMPGSLGVEAILQAMQGFALQQGLAERFQNPRFGWVQKRTAWKYRGQIIRETKRMQLEAHVTDVQEHLDQTVITANASLWRDDLRIYEVTDLRLALREAAA